jgi:uncharacterized protein (TIGR02284 family)
MVLVSSYKTFVMKNEDVVEILNDLVLIHNDRITGYEKAIKETSDEDQDLKDLYVSMIAESHVMKNMLITEVQATGGNAEQGTTTSGKIYRAWMDVKAVFTGHDAGTVLSNCEAGEDAALKAYTTALEHEGLPAYLREMLEQQLEALETSHDVIRDLRDQYKENPVE